MTLHAKSSTRNVTFSAEVGGTKDSLVTSNSVAIESIGNAIAPEQSQLAIEQQYRASTYSLLSSLFLAAPDQHLLTILSELLSEKHIN